MSEHALQVQVANLLDNMRLLWTAVPNAGLRTPRQGKWMKDEGLKKGVPDLLVFTAPASLPHQTPRVGLAIELKNGKKGRLSEHQETWLVRLELEGWRTCVCRDMDEVLALLRECYPGKLK